MSDTVDTEAEAAAEFVYPPPEPRSGVDTAKTYALKIAGLLSRASLSDVVMSPEGSIYDFLLRDGTAIGYPGEILVTTRYYGLDQRDARDYLAKIEEEPPNPKTTLLIVTDLSFSKPARKALSYRAVLWEPADLERLPLGLQAEVARPDDIAPSYRPHFSSDALEGKVSDNLGVTAQAETIARLLASATLPLAIGLFGNWGSGKSFFMQLIRQQIDEIAAQERIERTGIYHPEVAHITFNAWHYLDGNLWASLALRIFDGVAKHLAGNSSDRESSADPAKIRRDLAAIIESNRSATAAAEQAITAAEEDRAKCEAEVAELRKAREKTAKEFSLQGVELADAKKAAIALGIGKIENYAQLEKALAEGRESWHLAESLTPPFLRWIFAGAARPGSGPAAVVGLGFVASESDRSLGGLAGFAGGRRRLGGGTPGGGAARRRDPGRNRQESRGGPAREID